MTSLARPSKIVLLGAPLASSLHWDEQALQSSDTVNDLLRRELRCTGHQAQWRVLRPSVQPLEPSFLQPTAEPRNIYNSFPADAAFFRTADITSSLPSQYSISEDTSSIPATVQSSEDVLSEFYDHSFAVHDLTSSQIEAIDDYAGQKGGEHVQGTDLNAYSPASTGRSQVHPPISGHLSDVEDIPNAAYLRSIIPQTMTVNLIAAVMSLPTPRTVITGRQWGKERPCDLVEILVGDETKAGFGVTLWLANNADGETMRKQIKHLRLGDIVLFRNVALSSFRDKVHGQSLRRGITKVDLLFGKRIDDEDRRRGAYSTRDVVEAHNQADPQLMKARRVKDWMENFIGDTPDRHEHPEHACEQSNARRLTLPPDTQ